MAVVVFVKKYNLPKELQQVYMFCIYVMGVLAGFWVNLKVVIFRCLDILRSFEFQAGQVRMALQTFLLGGGRAGVVHCILEAIIGDELNPTSKDDNIYSSSGIFKGLAEVWFYVLFSPALHAAIFSLPRLINL